ncbi:MAG: ATP-binding protein [Planctomycetes bacterium]|nr:ATP-binding protein [Planctomycetota bacterium]
MSDRLNLLQALDVVAFTRVEAGRYRVLGEVSAELATRFPALRAEQLTLAEDFALLDAFLGEAERFWEGTDPGPLASASWTQEDAAGGTVELRALAVREGSGVLLLQMLGREQLRGVLQSAREQNLALEELARLEARLRAVAEQRRQALEEVDAARRLLEERVAARTAELTRSNRELLDHRQRLRSLADQLAMAEETERRRIAAFLHDQIGQGLAHVKISLGILGGEFGRERVAALGAVVDRLIQDTRRVTFEMGTPVLYDLGLCAALESLAEKFTDEAGIPAEFRGDPRADVLEHRVGVVLYHSVRELLHNVVKHAAARRVGVTARRTAEQVQIEIVDDGHGFDAAATEFRVRETGGFGLFHIRERLDHLGGTLQIHSAPGSGTRVCLTVPVAMTRAETDQP